MSQQLHLHCVWDVEQRQFVLRMGDKTFTLLPTTLKAAIDAASAAHTSDNQTFRLDFGQQGGLKFTGVTNETATQLIEYLQKVYNSWHKMSFADDGQHRTRIKP